MDHAFFPFTNDLVCQEKKRPSVISVALLNPTPPWSSCEQHYMAALLAKSSRVATCGRQAERCGHVFTHTFFFDLCVYVLPCSKKSVCVQIRSCRSKGESKLMHTESKLMHIATAFQTHPTSICSLVCFSAYQVSNFFSFLLLVQTFLNLHYTCWLVYNGYVPSQ
jgi:hypothetical protein